MDLVRDQSRRYSPDGRRSHSLGVPVNDADSSAVDVALLVLCLAAPKANTFGVLLCMMRKSMSLERPPYVENRMRPDQPRTSKPNVPATSPVHRSTRQPVQGWTLLVSVPILMLVWQVAVWLLKYPTWLFPGPLDVARRFVQVAADGTLLQHVRPTIIESIGGFGLALVVGSMLGYLVAYSRQLERWIAPYLAAAQAIPVIAVAPLILIWFGYSSDVLRNILVAAIVVVFPIFSTTITGVRGVPKELREVGLVEGATRWQRLRYIELPLALPVLFSGFRTSLAYATTGAVVGEFIGARYGLGALINVARGLFDTPLIFVALMCLGLITLLFYSVVVGLERLLLPWYEETIV